MKLTFLGATHEVTGSCSMVEVNDKAYLVDCGMEQGGDIYENQSLPIPATKIQAVFLTHAHIDHSGLLPMLYKDGFRGKIYTTNATKELCNIMLRDSAHIQEFEAEWRNRKAKRNGGELYVPLYTMKDAEGAIGLLRGVEYGDTVAPTKGISATFLDAGHLLGSASVLLTLIENGEERTIVFSGDLGNDKKPMLCDPQPPKHADMAVIESTYGDRLHGDDPAYVVEMAKVIDRTLGEGGNVVVPTFAVGRMQEMLYFLRIIKEQGLVKSVPDFPVYVDSPLAVQATDVFNRTAYNFVDEETKHLIDDCFNPLSFPGLRLSSTADDSKAINVEDTPKVILSASGMCEAGRIRHHLKHNIWREECTILFVGYQVEGTLGRALLDGVKTVDLFGDTIEVNCHIEKMTGTSSHADRDGLLRWLGDFEDKPRIVFVNHGEDSVCDEFAQTLTAAGYTADAPFSGEAWDMIDYRCLYEGNSQRIKDKKEKRRKERELFVTLASKAEELKTLVQAYREGTNNDLRNLARDIDRLIARYKI